MISIVIVNYKVKKELFECISSIIKFKSKALIEIIVVDNDEEKTIKKDLLSKFPNVKYIPSKKNLGFGAGNNLGVQHADGDYLFFLNPDTLLKPDAIDKLLSFLKKNKNIGIVGPTLLNPKGEEYPLQGISELTPLRGIIGFSFINEYFPKNPVSKKYWQTDVVKNKTREVYNVPGTAFMMKKDLFLKIGGFDEKFFLYFEEMDLCRRIRILGYKNYMVADSKVIHHWEKSTKKKNDIMKIFQESRYYYFKKHFGIFNALFVEGFLRLRKLHLLLSSIFGMAVFLRVLNLQQFSLLSGDHGWFLLSARDFIINGNFPLVGITSSHPFLHHGAFWTYLLIPLLYFSNFNILSPYYFTAFLDSFAVLAIYFLGKEMFSSKVGIISSFLYAISPFMVLNARLGYHISPVPLLSILFIFSVYKWMKGKFTYFPISIFLASILYNFELSNAILFPIPFILLAIQYKQKKETARLVLSRKYILFSIFGFLLPMIPFVIHGFSNKFSQTLGFIAWVFYRIGTFIIPSTKNSFSFSDIAGLGRYLEIYNQLIIPILLISIPILFSSIFYFFKKNYCLIKDKNFLNPYFLIFLWVFLPVLGMFFHKLPSEYHVLMLVPGVLIITSLFLSFFLKFKKMRIAIFSLLIFIAFFNFNHLLKTDFGIWHTIPEKQGAVGKIAKESKGEKFNLVDKGPFNYYESSLNDIIFLLSLKGIFPSEEKVQLQFLINQTKNKILVETVRGGKQLKSDVF